METRTEERPPTDEEQMRRDIATLRRSLPAIVGPATAELWLAFGRIERALGHGIYAATSPSTEPPETEAD